MVKKEWIKNYGRSERLGRTKSEFNFNAIYRYGRLLAIAFIPVFFFIWQNIKIVSSGYEIERMKRSLTSLQAQNSLLTMEAASLEDMYVMNKRATYELGMVQPHPGQIIYDRFPVKEKSNEEPKDHLPETEK